MDISNLIVRTNGNLDVKASLAAIRPELERLAAEEKTENVVIAEAVNAVFDKNPGVALNMPALTSMVATSLNATPTNWQVLTDRARRFIQQNAQGEKAEDGSYANPTSQFVITKGKGGGVRRRADIAPAS